MRGVRARPVVSACLLGGRVELGSNVSADEDRHEVVDATLLPAGEFGVDEDPEEFGGDPVSELALEFSDEPLYQR